MGTAIYNLLNTFEFAVGGKILTVLLLIIFLAYYFSREGRDERGRAIIGKASFFGMLSLIVTLNVVALFSNTVISDIRIFTSAICLVLVVYELVELIAIAILRKKR